MESAETVARRCAIGHDRCNVETALITAAVQLLLNTGTGTGSWSSHHYRRSYCCSRRIMCRTWWSATTSLMMMMLMSLRPSPYGRQSCDKRHILFVPAKGDAIWSMLFGQLRNGIRLHYPLGLLIGNRWSFQVATEWKTPSAAQHRQRHWISEAAGWRRPVHKQFNYYNYHLVN